MESAADDEELTRDVLSDEELKTIDAEIKNQPWPKMPSIVVTLMMVTLHVVNVLLQFQNLASYGVPVNLMPTAIYCSIQAVLVVSAVVSAARRQSPIATTVLGVGALVELTWGFIPNYSSNSPANQLLSFGLVALCALSLGFATKVVKISLLQVFSVALPIYLAIHGLARNISVFFGEPTVGNDWVEAPLSILILVFVIIFRNRATPVLLTIFILLLAIARSTNYYFSPIEGFIFSPLLSIVAIVFIWLPAGRIWLDKSYAARRQTRVEARVEEDANIPASVQLPGTKGVFWLSFCFGVFGYLLANSNQNYARDLGYPTRRYVKAFIRGWLWGIAASVAFTLIAYGILFGLLAISVPRY